MSKKVDERVVEMRFDNKDFESNVKTTMSTLDRLKAALKLPTSSKSLNSVSNAAKNSTSNISGLGAAVETVNARFSALQVVGMTALSNITSAAMRAGSNLVKQFTIEPITSGFREYETQLNAVQTILANTQSKGTTLDDVTAALDELNTYADKTIYNFTEMTRNIGTFTAAGVDLDASVSAIKGIANLAAVSGSTSQQASTAMYQLSQALATGRVSLMDWNSVVNAGMGGEVFQNALKRTAKVMGTDVDAMIEKYGSFRESLTQGGWLTSEVLTKTLEQFTMAAEEGSAEWDKFKASLMEEGYTEAQATEILRMANTATDAATKVKTFTQLMDTLSEAAGSGWAKTWQLIFGDFEEAKAFWTDLSEMFSGMINASSDARNAIIEGAMNMGGSGGWDSLSKQITDAGVSLDDFQTKLSEVVAEQGGSLDSLIEKYGSLGGAITSGEISADSIIETLKRLASSTDVTGESTEELNKKLEYFQDVVDRVWRGDFKNAPERYQLLADAGYDYAKVQELVNATVDGHRLTLEDLSDAQLISIGYTEEEVKQIRALAEEAEKAGTPLNELINNLSKKSGRELFLEGLKNILEAIMKPLQAVSGAFSEVFNMDASQLYGLIEAFNEFSKSIIISDEDAENLRKTFKGLFSIVKLVATVAGKSLTFAFKAANAILAPFGTNVLEITGFIGDAIYAFEEWITSGTAIEDALAGISSAVSWLIEPLRNFWDSMFPDDVAMAANNPLTAVVTAFESLQAYIRSFDGLSVGDMFSKLKSDVTGFFDSLANLSWNDVLRAARTFGEKFREIFSKLGDKLATLGPDIIEGFQNGLKDGWDKVLEFLGDIAERAIELVKAILGIHSPSTVFFEIGKNIVEGLCNGIKYVSGQVTDTLATIIGDIQYLMSTIDWGAVIGIGVGVGSFVVLYKLTDALQIFATGIRNITSPLGSASKVLDSIAGAIDTFSGNIKGNRFVQTANAIKTMATAIAILAGSIVVLTMIDQTKMWDAVKAIGALAAILTIMTAILTMVANSQNAVASLNGLKLGGIFVSLGVSLLALAGVMKIMGTLDEKQFAQALGAISVFWFVAATLLGISKIPGANNTDGVSKFIRNIGVAFLLMSASAKILGTMQPSELNSAYQMVLLFGGVCAALIAVTLIPGSSPEDAANFMTKIGVAFLALAATAKIIGTMSPEELNKGISAITAFGLIIGGLIAVGRLVGGNKIDDIGSSILQVAGAIAVISVAAKILGTMSPAEWETASVGLLGISALVVGLIAVGRLAGGGEMAKIGTSLLAMSVSIGILAGIAVLLSYVDTDNLVKGIAAVAVLALLVSMMAKAASGASDAKGTMLGIAATIGVMAASIAVLSFLDPRGVVVATACMTVLMGMVALVAKMSSDVKTSWTTMVSLAAVIAIMAGSLAVLSSMPIEGTLASAVSLGGLMVVLAGVCKTLSGIQTFSGAAMGSMGILTAIMLGLAAMLTVMSVINVQNAIPNATALSILLGVMTGITVILSKANVNAQAALQGAIALAEVIGVITIVIAAIVGIAGAIGQIKGSLEFIQTAGDVLQGVGEAIGGFVDGIVGGFGEAVTDSLPAIGENLSTFAENLSPFLSAVSGIDPSIGESISNLGTGLLALTAGGLLEQLTQFFGGGSNIEALGTQLPLLGTALSGFAMATAFVDGAKVSAASQALKTVIEGMASVPNSGGLLEGLFGGKNYTGFSEGMASLGTALQSFDSATTGVTVEGLQPKVEALKTVIDGMANVPTSGGLLGDLLGGKNYTDFADGMTNIGTALQNFNESTKGIDSPDHVKKVAEALTTLIGGMAEIPSSGGWLDNLFGGQDYTNFAEGLKSIGTAINDFAVNTSGIEDAGKFKTIVDATRTLMDGLAGIQNTGGLLGMLIGGQDFTAFSNAITEIGRGMTSLAGISLSIGDGIGNLGTVVDATNTLITGLANITSTGGLFSMMLDGESFDGLSASLSSLGTGISNYANATAETAFENVETSINAANKILEFISSTATLNTSGIETFKTAVDSLAETNISSLVQTFSDSSGQMADVGKGLVASIAEGLSGSSDTLKTSAQGVIDNIVAAINDKKGDFNTAGVTLITEVANGIRDSSGSVTGEAENAIKSAKQAAENLVAWNFWWIGTQIGYGIRDGIQDTISAVASKASDMVKQAISAAKAAADVNSPSREFYWIGEMSGLGFVNALDDYQAVSYKAGRSLADSSIDGLSQSISKIGSMLDSEMNVNPTIRPVMDLSEVKNGAASISDMLNSTNSIGIGHANTIDRMMNSRVQNGSFIDVVSAVDRLRGALNDIGNTTYQVNGVTYDDGSNIARAVGDLTRAIRLEGRV